MLILRSGPALVDPVYETTAPLVHEVGHCLVRGHIAAALCSVLHEWGQADREHGSANVTPVGRRPCGRD